jgi:hypothetical protein
MGLFDFLKPKPKVSDWRGLADFVSDHAAYLVNRSMFEYSRARAGPHAEKLFREKAFQAAIEASRWSAYPIGAETVSEYVQARLRAAAPAHHDAITTAMVGAVEDALSRYPVPEGFEADFWDRAREEARARLWRARLAAPRSGFDIPATRFDELFALMPIHPDLKAIDYVLVRNNVRASMSTVEGNFGKRVDVPALLAALPAPTSPSEA